MLLNQGCASVGSIVSQPDGTYVTSASTPNFIAGKGSTAKAIASTISEAKIFCSKSIPGGVPQIISVQEDPAGGTKGGRASLNFRCTK